MRKISIEGLPLIAGGVTALSALVLAHAINTKDTPKPSIKAPTAFEGVLLPGDRQLNYYLDGSAMLDAINSQTGNIATIAVYSCVGPGGTDPSVIYPEHHDGDVYPQNSHCVKGAVDPSTGVNLPGMHS